MNVTWRFWEWPGEIIELRKAVAGQKQIADEFWEKLYKAQDEAKGLAQAHEQMEERLRAVYQRTPAIVTEAEQRNADMERLLTLAGLPEDHPVWKTALSYADEHARNETTVALAGNLDDAGRHYNAGRAAAATDFAAALRDLKFKAAGQARKLSKEKE